MKNKQPYFVIVLSFIAFISLGLPDGLMGVAWPYISKELNVPLDYVGMLLIGGTAGYILSSFFSPQITRYMGVGALLGTSCAATAVALLAYGSAPVWFVMVFFSFFLGIGAGAIDAGINTYIAQNYSQRMMQWLHASFGIGITAGPLIMTYGLAISGSWRTGYFAVGAIQLFLGLVFYIHRRQWKSSNQRDTGQPHEIAAPLCETLKLPSAYLSIVMFSLYTGVEMGLGLWIYTILTKSRGINPEIAGVVTAVYWGTFTVGRILAGLYTDKIKPARLLTGAMLLGTAGLILIIIHVHVVITIAGIAVTGFAFAPIFPGLVSDTEDRVGKAHQANTIGMQLAGAGFGTAAVPALAGIIADTYSVEMIPITLLASFVLLFAAFVVSHVTGKDHSPQ